MVAVHTGTPYADRRRKTMMYYRTLGVAADASATELRRAYRQRAAATHPDRTGSDDYADFLSVQTAYETLSDPVRRAAYDRGHAHRAAAPEPKTAAPPREPKPPYTPGRPGTSHRPSPAVARRLDRARKTYAEAWSSRRDPASVSVCI